MTTFTDRQIVNFFRKFDQTEDGCWEWKASLTKQGYGQFGTADLASSGLAHRFSYIYYFGDIPEGMFVCHHCDNRKCVRPDHLFLGTNKDNMDDRKDKGLGRVVGEKGELHTLAKLTDAKVVELRRRIAAGELALDIANEMNLSLSTITRAAIGQTWSHVPNPLSPELFNNTAERSGPKRAAERRLADMLESGLKECNVCHEIKPLDAFGKNKRCPGGIDRRCKECNKTASQLYQKNKRELSLKSD